MTESKKAKKKKKKPNKKEILRNFFLQIMKVEQGLKENKK